MVEHRRLNGKWWLVTSTTFGTWLPGDPRGFQSFRGRRYVPPPKRYAKPGEATYDPTPYADLHANAKAIMTQPAVWLSEDQCLTVVDAIVRESGEMLDELDPAIMCSGSCHVHLLSKFAKKIRMQAGRLKAAATRRLHEHGFEYKRVWGRNCHSVSKETPRAARNAFDYVARHAEEGAAVHVWRVPDFETEC